MSLLVRRQSALVLLVAMLAGFLGLAASLLWLRLSPEFVLALTIAAIALAIMALRPYVAVHIFLLVLFFENSLNKVAGLTVMKGLGVVIMGGWLASVMMQRRIGVSRNAMHLAISGFLAWAGICVVGALDVGSGIVQFTSYCLLILSSIMFNSVIQSPRHLRGIQIAFISWTVLATLVAIVMYYAGATKVAVGFVGNRNTLGLYINLAVVCALLLFPSSSRIGQLGIVASLPVLFLGLALTLSRTGFVVMLPALLAVWYRLARHRGMLILLGSAATVVALLLILPGAFWQRTRTIVPAIEQRQDTFGLRVRVWELAGQMIQDHPIMGVGPGNFVPASQRYAHGEMLGMGAAPHNVYILVAAEMGLIGLGAFVAIVTLGIINARRAFRRARDDGDEGLALSAVAVEMMIWVMLGQGLTGDVLPHKHFWLIVGLALAVDGLTSHLARTATARSVAAERTAPEGVGA